MQNEYRTPDNTGAPAATGASGVTGEQQVPLNSAGWPCTQSAGAPAPAGGQKSASVLTLEERQLAYQLFALRIDGASLVWGGLALQRDSEFLGLFNYYILKALEHGIIKRLYHSHHIDLYVKEQFGMVEPQPLTYKNVMFTFIFLGFGLSFAIMIALLEQITQSVKRCVKDHRF